MRRLTGNEGIAAQPARLEQRQRGQALVGADRVDRKPRVLRRALVQPPRFRQVTGVDLVEATDETRPLLQGARLTAWELKQRGIEATLICDSMAAQVMREGRVQAVVTGADRIAANGDVANKIGTYGLAVAARHHGVRFMVAAPTSTIDPATPDGRPLSSPRSLPLASLRLARQPLSPPLFRYVFLLDSTAFHLLG